MSAAFVILVILWLLNIALGFGVVVPKLSVAAIFWMTLLGLLVTQIVAIHNAARPAHQRPVQPKNTTVIRPSWPVFVVALAFVGLSLAIVAVGGNDWPALKPFSIWRYLAAAIPLAISLLHVIVVYTCTRLRNRPVRQAIQLARDGRDHEAIVLLRSQLATPKLAPAVATYLAVILVRQRKFSEALETIETHIGNDGEQAQLLKLTWRSRLGREVDQPELTIAAIEELKTNFGDLLVTRLHEIRWLRESDQLERAHARTEQTIADFESGTLQTAAVDRAELDRWLGMNTAEADEQVWNDLFGPKAGNKSLGW